jgi:catechol 2,3-dioxygenase-like lactoylglutathione lyase family enzyme
MTQTTVVVEDSTRMCSCCGKRFPAGKVAELGMAPGVFVCVGCALWAARRASTLDGLLRLPQNSARAVVRWLRPTTLAPGDARSAIPILPVADLDRTAQFYAPLGFAETERYPGYLLLNSGDAELHFSQLEQVTPGECFIHVGDARQLWKRLKADETSGVGILVDQDYGLREFIVTDPDGNHVRFGSPAN